MGVFAIIENRTTFNVIATTNCGSPNTTLVSGHSNSVAASPSIGDDGSGSVGVLEVAKQLSKYRVNNVARFGWWSGEEGLLGSTYYVESLSRAYLNFDIVASPNYIYAIYDGDGSAEIKHFFKAWFADNGLNSNVTAFDGRSDHQVFINNGIPAGGAFTGGEEIKTEEAAMFGGRRGSRRMSITIKPAIRLRI